MRAIIMLVAVTLLVSCRKEQQAAPAPTVLEFTDGSTTYQLTSDDVTAQETVTNGVHKIEITGSKKTSDSPGPLTPYGSSINVWISISANNQIDPGVYTPSSATLRYQDDDVVYPSTDFSLQVMNYQNDTLSGTFSSHYISNGKITNLKVLR